MHYLLFYEVADDYLARRAEFRDAHLEKAWTASERGELLLGGALQDPVDGAVLLFQADSPEVAKKFARTDPLCDERAGEALACAGVEDGVGRRLCDAHQASFDGRRRHESMRVSGRIASPYFVRRYVRRYVRR
jgi:uncharacterized protein YciI